MENLPLNDNTSNGAMMHVVPAPELVEFGLLQAAPYNPRIMPPGEMAALKASLIKHGLVEPLVVQRNSEQYGFMVIIGGHQRRTAMLELHAERGLPPPEEIWCVVLDIKDIEAKQLNVSLNNIGGDFDPIRLGELLRSIQGELDVQSTLALGFGDEELMKYLAEPEVPLPMEAEIAAISGGPSDMPPLGLTESTVKMVQLFFTAEQHAEFLAKCAFLGKHFGTTTLSDTVREALDSIELEELDEDDVE
jgi:hypothetical protein